MPTVSVIIPTYNRSWILAEAVESVLAQDHPDFEVIVVDDGSTDHTDRVLEKYAAAIRVIKQSNQGVSAARNRGIEVSGGDLIAFLDSDDLWLPEKLTAQVTFFRHHPDAMICQTEEIWIRNGQRVNPKHRHRKPSGMIFEPSLALCLVSPSAVMIKRELFAKVGLFDESMPACEDYDMWLRISCDTPVFLIDSALTIKRGGHSDQLSRQPSLDKYRVFALQKAIDQGRLSEVQRQAAARMLQKKCRIYAEGCLRRGRQKEADTFFKLARKYAP